MAESKNKNHTKSKQRIADHGEVFTSDREVKAMLDLVKTETERIESRFLEPACGNGNFLAEILRRKLSVVKKKYSKDAYKYEVNAVKVVTSIYGVELLPDNVDECQERLFRIFDEEYTAICKSQANDECRGAVRYILSRNILCGDALTMKTPDETAPLVFPQWSMMRQGLRHLLKRHDYEFRELVETADLAESGEATLLRSGVQNDQGKTVFIPIAIREYPATDYKEVQRYD